MSGKGKHTHAMKRKICIIIAIAHASGIKHSTRPSDLTPSQLLLQLNLPNMKMSKIKKENQKTENRKQKTQ